MILRVNRSSYSRIYAILPQGRMIRMKKRKFGELSRYIIIISIFLILVNLVLGLFLINQSQDAIIYQIEGRMLDIANTAADMLNGDELGRMTKDDVDTPEYQKVVATLSNFWANIQLKYIYCIKQVGEKEFVFSIDPTQPDPGEFGEPVVYTDALYAASKGTASVDKVPYEDDWGRFYSAYSPVFDSQGKVAGIVAVDFSADWYDEQLAAQRRTVLVVCGLSLLAGGLVVVIITERTRKRNRLLYAQLNSLADNIEALVDEVSHTTGAEHGHSAAPDPEVSGDDIRDLSWKIESMQDNLREEIVCVHRMAYIDALTGVGNASAYMEAVSELNSRIAAGDAVFSVVAFDMNGLKKINDHYGHDNGDKAIIDAVGVICRVFGHDHVYRVGGDEFIAILSAGDTEEIDRLFARFDDALEEENKKEKTYHLPLSISKGCAVFEKEKDTEYKSVFQRADTTMYQDKDAYYAARRRNRQ